MYQVQVAIGQTFPATLLFRTDGTVTILGHQGASPVADNEGTIKAIFDQEGFSLFEDVVDDGQTYCYNTPYVVENMPVLKAYLVQLNLELPR